MEKKIIESVNECDVPSLEDIKKRIDFYAHNKIGVNKGGSFNEKL